MAIRIHPCTEQEETVAPQDFRDRLHGSIPWVDLINATSEEIKVVEAALGGGAIRDPEASARLAAQRREIARSFVDWSLGAQRPLWDRLHEITVPVLWIAGENDAKFRGLAGRAVSQIPHASLAIAPAAGHRVPWEAEEWLAERVAGFFSSAA